MSSGGSERGSCGGLVGGEVVVDDAGEASFEAAQGFGGGHSFCLLLLVVGLTQAVHADLGSRRCGGPRR